MWCNTTIAPVRTTKLLRLLQVPSLPHSNAAVTVKQLYQKHLYAYEEFCSARNRGVDVGAADEDERQDLDALASEVQEAVEAAAILEALMGSAGPSFAHPQFQPRQESENAPATKRRKIAQQDNKRVRPLYTSGMASSLTSIGPAVHRDYFASPYLLE